ncbi:DgyrCDS6835 [Dimorphilus gyrociliatus]|uniref:DgyrCDS6835 n=2 Tax=Dimorphilus gyrociliatus TaxID=2664684 RepID=A0A7I8VPU1_9ANNE|nr:DgyrCDS6835 [Dimorphilus gyrociliatus]
MSNVSNEFMDEHFYSNCTHSSDTMTNSGSDDSYQAVEWKNVIPEKWDCELVQNYIAHILYRNEFDNDRIVITQDKFRECNGQKLMRMQHHDFIQLDPDSGTVIYREFQELNRTPHTITKTARSKREPAAKKPRTPSTRGRKPGQLSKGNHLWEFLRDLLNDDRSNPHLLKWVNREEGIFRIVKSEQVAKFWGDKKKRPKMSYEKMSRAIRFCRDVGYFGEVPKNVGHPKKLIFKFGNKAHGWDKKDPNANLDFLKNISY